MPSSKGFFPKLHGKSGFFPSRSGFLSGDLKTYFGPGQDPDSGMGNGLPNLYVTFNFEGQNTDAEPIEKVYTPPTDWPQKGFLLRVPQVVYLSNNYNNRVITGQLDLDGSDFDGGIGIEAARIDTIYSVVKAAIEAIRPGKTWVSIVPWVDKSSPCPQGIVIYDITASEEEGTLVPTPFDQTTFANFSVESSFTFTPCPPPGSVFFGTNFLHIYSGFPLWFDSGGVISRPIDDFYDQSESTDGTQYITFSYTTSSPTAEFDTDNPGMRDAVGAALLEAVPKFAGYSLKCFTTQIGAPPRDSVYYQDYGDFPMLTFQEDWAKKFFVKVFNDWAEAMPESNFDFDWVDYTTALDVDYLTRLIAEHFGFDPDTGDDVG